MKLLLYRGFYTEYKAERKTLSCTPCAVNWRYQIEGKEVISRVTNKRMYKAPKAINWRWQY